MKASLAVAMLATLELGACYSPNLDPCRVTCDDSDHCPGAQLCMDDGFCHTPGDELRCNPDAAPLDAGPDATPDAGPDAEPMPLPRISTLTARGDFACVIDDETRLYCWGYNRRGAVGVSTATLRVVAPLEVGGGPGWTAVSAGDEHVCGIKAGEVYCWGSDDNGESSDASPNHLETPTLRPGTGTGWTAIAAGQGFTCGVRDDAGARHVYCWGADDNGQLGNGASGGAVGTTYLQADASDGAHDDWKTVAAGVDTACALRDGGEAYCWGLNALGQAGDGNIGGNLQVPTRVVASLDGGQQLFTAITAGSLSSCAVGVDGGLYCWGSNGYNLLGSLGLAATEPAPRRIGSATDWSAISVYYYLACGSRADGVYCWGAGTSGAAGDGTWGYPTTPSKVEGITTPSLVSAGFREACAAPMSGGVLCWGENPEGELGIGEISTKHVPTMIPPAGGWTAVSAGANHTCGIRAGVVMCWGWDIDGQLTGTENEGARVPTAVPGVPTATEIAVGDFHSCALADDGGGTRPWCWGFNTDGQVGFGSLAGRKLPAELDVAGTWHDLVATARATCALDGSTRVCWGLGSGYGLGNNAISQVTTPTAVSDGATWQRHALGVQFGCGVQTGGALACWGIDSFDSQGDGGASTTAMVPHVIDAATSYTHVAAHSSDHACAIQADGDLACWGRNDYGETGQTAGGTTPTPAVVTATGDWTAVATGFIHTCGLKTGAGPGELWCWGNQQEGQLGIDDAYYTLRDAPVKVVTLDGWDVLSAGTNHTCAIRDGDLYCWGANVHGQLGDGTGAYNTPQTVSIP